MTTGAMTTPYDRAMRDAIVAAVRAAEGRAERAEAALREIVATSECRCALVLEQACPRCIAADVLDAEGVAR